MRAKNGDVRTDYSRQVGHKLTKGPKDELIRRMVPLRPEWVTSLVFQPDAEDV